MTTKTLVALVLGFVILTNANAPVAPEAPSGGTAASFAEVYHSLAASILANKSTEHALVHGILTLERDLAMAALERAAMSDTPQADIRTAATHIGDFATEGGAVIEPVRNHLLKQGHHHHADDTGPDAKYDPGYVIVTRMEKKEALDLAKRCARLGGSSEVDAGAIKGIHQAFVDLSTRALGQKK